MKKFLGVLLGMLVLMAGLSFGSGEMEKSPEPKRIKWVLVPAADADAELEMYEPIARHLESQLGMPVELIVSSDYSTAIVSLKSGDSQLARLTPFSTVLASTVMDVDPIVRGVKKSTGKAAYTSILIVRKDSGIKTFEDLEGKVFAFTDEASTSGYLVPSALFAEKGINPEVFFAKIYLSGGQDASVLAVKNRKVDGACVAIHRYEKAVAKGLVDPNEIEIIYESGPIPTSPNCVSGDMNPVLRQKIIDAFLTVPKELSLKAVGKLSHYEETKLSDYNYIRKIAESLNLLKSIK